MKKRTLFVRYETVNKVSKRLKGELLRYHGGSNNRKQLSPLGLKEHKEEAGVINI